MEVLLIMDRLDETDERILAELAEHARATFAEIGHVLEISQNTAASRYRYALGALKKILQPHE